MGYWVADGCVDEVICYIWQPSDSSVLRLKLNKMNEKRDPALLPEQESAMLLENVRVQKEFYERDTERRKIEFRQDCRRTSLQLAERFTKDAEGLKSGEVVNIIQNAEILYLWMVQDLSGNPIDTTCLDFDKTGNLCWKSKEVK